MDEVRINYLDYMRPISEFPKTDDEDQPLLIMKAKNGLMFRGVWDGAAGHFMIDSLVFAPETEEQEECVKRMEIPGRVYIPLESFLYST